MKKTIIAAVVAGVAFSLTSCRTTEANYRAAYERTIARQNEGIDSATVAAIENERGPRQMRINDSISLPVVSRFVKAVEGGGGTRESIKKYSVVVAGFSQLFNARSMRERLVDSGKWLGAFVVQSGEEYFVVAQSSDDPAEASRALDSVKADGTIYIKSPFPWVLRRPR